MDRDVAQTFKKRYFLMILYSRWSTLCTMRGYMFHFKFFFIFLLQHLVSPEVFDVVHDALHLNGAGLFSVLTLAAQDPSTSMSPHPPPKYAPVLSPTSNLAVSSFSQSPIMFLCVSISTRDVYRSVSICTVLEWGLWLHIFVELSEYWNYSKFKLNQAQLFMMS